MELLYIYLFPMLVGLGLVFMRATDLRGTQHSWTRGDVLKFCLIAILPGFNIMLALMMLLVVLLESDQYDRFRNWSRRDF